MKKHNFKEISSTNTEEQIAKARQELFNLQFKQSTQKNIKPHILRETKHLIAQLLTKQKQ